MDALNDYTCSCCEFACNGDDRCDGCSKCRPCNEFGSPEGSDGGNGDGSDSDIACPCGAPIVSTKKGYFDSVRGMFVPTHIGIPCLDDEMDFVWMPLEFGEHVRRFINDAAAAPQILPQPPLRRSEGHDYGPPVTMLR